MRLSWPGISFSLCLLVENRFSLSSVKVWSPPSHPTPTLAHEALSGEPYLLSGTDPSCHGTFLEQTYHTVPTEHFTAHASLPVGLSQDLKWFEPQGAGLILRHTPVPSTVPGTHTDQWNSKRHVLATL